jgi:hypothetical protein
MVMKMIIIFQIKDDKNEKSKIKIKEFRFRALFDPKMSSYSKARLHPGV